MLGKRYTLVHVGGIPVRLHISLVLFIPMMISAGSAFGLPLIAVLITATLLGVGILTSIALHELGHCFVAMRFGSGVHEILLTPIGGAAQMTDIPRRPLHELLMALAGPAVSIVLAGLFWLVGSALPLYSMRLALSYDLYVNVFVLLAALNVMLVLFNLLPAFPMDGGRVLRALLSLRMSRVRATWVASRLGRVFAVLFGLLGIGAVAAASFAQGLVLIAIAVLIYRAAGNEYLIVRVQEGYGAGFAARRPAGPPGDDVEIGPPPYAKRAGRTVHTQPY